MRGSNRSQALSTSVSRVPMSGTAQVCGSIEPLGSLSDYDIRQGR
ncbi:hypothetical protein HMPREF9622_01980 [Cutibacterium modestum HL037PA3]|nr:hypothetical protein HMPREF9622_01980 [Cutibacterium modestum HL037PA3]